ncbi:MAG: hypothetical protein VX594_02695 [Actinomycetota bacterium]|nr:hypothetical protein [Actinomycetota bacterium]
MASSHGNWANEVRYYHGKGNAPRRSIHFPFFTVIVLGLSILTVVALVVEIS